MRYVPYSNWGQNWKSIGPQRDAKDIPRRIPGNLTDHVKGVVDIVLVRESVPCCKPGCGHPDYRPAQLQ
jgi:hypothetical protein